MGSTKKIIGYSELLSRELDDMRQRSWNPNAEKQFVKKFTTNELAKLFGIPESTFRVLTLENKGPQPERLENNRRVYTIEQMLELRKYLATVRRDDSLKIDPIRRNGEKLQIIACTNFKGGSSKTTTSVHLAHFLALKGYRVLCVDLDPQASLSTMFGLQPEFDVNKKTIYNAITYNEEERISIADVVRPTYFPNIDLIPCDISVMEFEFDTPLNINTVDEFGPFYLRMRNAIWQIEENYDICIIDTPPSLGYITMAAMFAATSLIVTVHPAMLDLASVNQYLLMIADIMGVLEDSATKNELEHDFIKFLLTRHDTNDRAQSFIAAKMRSTFNEDVLFNSLLESTAVASAAVGKRSLYELENGDVGRETLKRATESFDLVNGEILDLIWQVWGRK